MSFQQKATAIFFCLLVNVLALQAQPSRIAGAIDFNKRVKLRGNAAFHAPPNSDQGPVDPSFPMSYVTLYTLPTVDQQKALSQLLANQQDRSSPQYHQWLTPEQYADRFGLNLADFGKIASWLQSEGFTIRYQARGRNWIAFSGTAGQIARTFHTAIHRYLVEGKTHFANAANPSIPSALADAVAGLRGLTDFHPKPMYTNGSTNYLAPGDVATIYDINALYNAGFDGSGQTIVIAGQTDIYASDVAAFRAAFGLSTQAQTQSPNCDAASLCMVLTGSDPGISSGDLDEAELDLEWSGAVARNATIVYAYSTDAFMSAFYAIDQNLGPVLSISYGICEAQFDQLGDGTLPAAESEAQKGNALGITWVAASGDAGPAACDWDATRPPREASQGLAVNAPASIPEVTAVGGTEFNEGNGSYWGATGANGGTALSYIPEMAWNDTSYGTDLSNTLSASGGGVSIQFPVPAWQTGTGFPNDGGRDLPDMALSASPNHDSYVFCFNQTTCFDGSGNPNNSVGGTSVAAPAFAGMLGLLNQYLVSKGFQASAGVGNINPTLYSLGGTSAFHDITSGSNIVPCRNGSPDCSMGSFGYSTGPGYDQVTGLGSIDAYNLITSWESSQSETISGQVTLSGSGSALNGVAVALRGSQSGSTTTSGSGNYSFSVPAGGNYTVAPTLTGYTFDPASLSFNTLAGNQTANFVASTVNYTISGNVTLNVGSTPPDLGGVTVTLGGSQSVSATTNSAGNYSLTVPSTGNYTLTPSATGYSFNPASLSFSNLSANQVGNFSASPNLALAAPFGSFDTPAAASSNVNGSVGFTGWALSPAGISVVDIWREANPGEAPPGYLVYIGTGASISGSRPDIAGLYPSYPENASAGWGVLMLTNELPSNNGTSGRGNGTYRIHAIAHDLTGNSTDLGVKTIVVDNKDALTPFGSIDTPAQGGTVSGSRYVNFGWALTPEPAIIPASGSTIVVYIDGKPSGHPVYSNYRVDIATLFPGYANSLGAVGYYYIDTTQLTNGLHTISWGVTDSAGRKTGIGSRFFIVQN